MIIGFDIDNIICNTTESVLNVHHQNTKEQLTIGDIKSYYIEKWVSPQYRDNFYSIFLDKRVWKQIKLIDGCVECINKLLDDGHDIYFVTSTEAANLAKKQDWLQRNFPRIEVRKRLISTPNKQLVSGLDILIDDYEKNLIGGEYLKILFDYPWNRGVDDDYYSIIRVKNHKEVYDEVATYARFNTKCPFFEDSTAWKKCINCKHCTEDDGCLTCQISGKGNYEKE